jgi:F1F0 ATPase subunit 2
VTAVAYLALGVAAGASYFASLWWTAQRLAHDGPTVALVALIVARMAALTGLLYLASRGGALPLLMTALGVLAARAVVMRGARVAA